MKYCQLTLQNIRYQHQKGDIQWMQINVFCANIKVNDVTYEGTRVFCRILFLDDLRFESSVNSQGKQTTSYYHTHLPIQNNPVFFLRDCHIRSQLRYLLILLKTPDLFQKTLYSPPYPQLTLINIFPNSTVLLLFEQNVVH